MFAGVAQVKTHAIEPFLRTLVDTLSLKQAWEAIHWENIGPAETYFDEPGDAAAIRAGMDLYRQYGYDINVERLREVLERYGHQLHRGTPQP